jgi:CheY-like chemotaxis protein
MVERKLLVVDDEKQICELYATVFSNAGYTVTTAGSAEEALEILKKERYWVMFLDLNLPGMNGIDLCRKIRQAYAMVIAYAVTGYTSLFELNECREAGFEDYFTKPVDLADLREAADIAFKKIDRWKNKSKSR